jgi:hypothetical protein
MQEKRIGVLRNAAAESCVWSGVRCCARRREGLLLCGALFPAATVPLRSAPHAKDGVVRSDEHAAMMLLHGRECVCLAVQRCEQQQRTQQGSQRTLSSARTSSVSSTQIHTVYDTEVRQQLADAFRACDAQRR